MAKKKKIRRPSVSKRKPKYVQTGGGSVLTVEQFRHPCEHSRCTGNAKIFTLLDDHDSSAGTFDVGGYCSLECFACDIMHGKDNPAELEIVLSRLQTQQF